MMTKQKHKNNKHINRRGLQSDNNYMSQMMDFN